MNEIVSTRGCAERSVIRYTVVVDEAAFILDVFGVLTLLLFALILVNV